MPPRWARQDLNLRPLACEASRGTFRYLRKRRKPRSGLPHPSARFPCVRGETLPNCYPEDGLSSDVSSPRECRNDYGDWIGLSLQVVATVAAAAAAFAAWRSVVGVSKERKADARWRADEHLKHIHALITEWSQAYFQDRHRALIVLMALRSEVRVMTELEGPLPRRLALTTTDARTIMPDDVSGLAEAAIAEVEDAQARVWKGHTVELS
jgi:hypothetical protein